MSPQIFTIQLDETVLTSFLNATTYTNHAYNMNDVKRATAEAIWDFGEHLLDAIQKTEATSLEDVWSMMFGYSDTYPLIDLPKDVVDSYLEALETLNSPNTGAVMNPYQDAIDSFRRNESVLGRQ